MMQALARAEYKRKENVMINNEYYQAKGTLQICPYSGEQTIILSFGSDTDKSQCTYHKECIIDPCPLE